ncbi:MAG: glycerophosphodiester phosphodiesterase [Betaproteobacteria bacterium]
MTRTRVVAHRGSSAMHAENSWAAFQAALAEGADVIECDVQGTLDGVLVIRHDLAIGHRLVAQCSAAEIESLEPEMVRLIDLLEWAPSVGMDLLIEVKDPAVAGLVGDMVAAGSWRERIVVGGFHGPALAAVKSRAASVATSLMIGTVLAAEDMMRLAQAYRADGVHLCWETRSPHPHRLLDAAAIALLRKARLAITLWHEEREDELRALVALRPDAICTNTPATLRRIVDECATAPVTQAMAAYDRIQQEG